MAFTLAAVVVGGTVAAILLITGLVFLFVTRNNPPKRKWGWLIIALAICALISAVVNAYGILY